MFCAIARRTPRRPSTGAAGLAGVVAAFCTSATVITPSGPDGVIWASSRLSWRASARAAGNALTAVAPLPALAGVAGGAASTCWPTGTAPTTVPASSSPSNPTSGAPRCTSSPFCPNSLMILPEYGDGISPPTGNTVWVMPSGFRMFCSMKEASG